jgi:hypothetical protein
MSKTALYIFQKGNFIKKFKTSNLTHFTNKKKLLQYQNEFYLKCSLNIFHFTWTLNSTKAFKKSV